MFKEIIIYYLIDLYYMNNTKSNNYLHIDTCNETDDKSIKVSVT